MARFLERRVLIKIMTRYCRSTGASVPGLGGLVRLPTICVQTLNHDLHLNSVPMIAIPEQLIGDTGPGIEVERGKTSYPAGR